VNPNDVTDGDNDQIDQVDDGTVERDALLRERGYDPDELTDAEQEAVLEDIDKDPTNDQLANIVPDEEDDGTNP
jgi:hypothetical protein